MAERLGAEIVSVDSMAVYRGLDIGTAKPGPAERTRVPHHLIDVVAPSVAYNVARWLAEVATAIAGIRSRGHRVLFVGGTPLYLRALRDGLAEVPGEVPEVRERLRAEVEAIGTAPLHDRLAAVDPEAARRIHPTDAKRIVRALEVAACGGPLSAAFAPAPHPVFGRQMMVVDVSRDLLRARIDHRVERMFATGLVEETRRAAEGPGGIGPTAAQAAGYTEALGVLAGTLSLADAIRLTQQRTRQLAKRQLTWLRSFPGAVWIAA
jgi:tRNA dimethylallyltransferase